MDLDLGSKVRFNVKYDGQSYSLTAPTVLQAQTFQKWMSDKPGNEVECFLQLVDKLGLPRDVAESMDLNQLKLLSEKLLGMNEKK